MKERMEVVLFIAVLVILLLLPFVASAVGAGGIIIFGDVIVCILFLIWILIKKILKK